VVVLDSLLNGHREVLQRIGDVTFYQGDIAGEQAYRLQEGVRRRTTFLLGE
jgi:UDP-glucose 4-epimerase